MTSKAIGFIETIGLSAAIEAADAAAKSANVTLLGYENTKGGGMITVKIAGDVGAVKAAVSAGSAAAMRVGRVASCLVIPRPHAEVDALIHQVDRGRAAQPAWNGPVPPLPPAPARAEAPKPAKAAPKAARPIAQAKPLPKPAPSKSKPAALARPKPAPQAEKPAAPAKIEEPLAAPPAALAEPDAGPPIAADRPEEPPAIE